MLSVCQRQTDVIRYCYNLFQECALNNLLRHKWHFFLLWGLSPLHSFCLVSTFFMCFFLDQINHCVCSYIAHTVHHTEYYVHKNEFQPVKKKAFNNILLFFYLSSIQTTSNKSSQHTVYANKKGNAFKELSVSKQLQWSSSKNIFSCRI